VAEASDGEEALAVVQSHPCDVVLLDVVMPKRDGLEVLKLIKKQDPHLPVLMLTMHSENEYGLRLLRAGAAGFLPKNSTAEVLVSAIRKVARGGRYLSTALSEKLAFDYGNADRSPQDALSDREYQTLALIGSGKTVTEIAEQLGLSVKTVSTYRSRILEKLQMNNNAEMIRYAIRNEVVG